MKRKDWILWTNITFKTESYRKNFDFICDNESYITEHSGTIMEVRISENKPPLIIGEFGISVWNTGLGRKFSVDFNQLLADHSFESGYKELSDAVKDKSIDFNDYKKIVLVQTFILRSDYRKRGITEEFTEYLFRDFYDENVAIIALFKPFQDNPIDHDYYLNQKTIPVKENLDDLNDIKYIPAVDYYSLNELLEKKDKESNEYHLFSVASKCGFKRIGDNCLFLFSPEKTIERMINKDKNMKISEII